MLQIEKFQNAKASRDVTYDEVAKFTSSNIDLSETISEQIDSDAVLSGANISSVSLKP